MAGKKTIKVTGYEIKVVGDPNYCGIGAGGVQFSYGKAQITGGRMADWFREHDGYEVTEIADDVDEAPNAPAE